MNAERLLAHFEKISEAPDAIARLRRFILDLAVRGKLVEQDPEDEPAEELMARIAHDAAKVSKRPKRGRTSSTSSLDMERYQQAPPDGWILMRLANLVSPERAISYGVLVPGNHDPKGIPFVRAQDLALAGHPIQPGKCIAPEIERAYSRTRLLGGEILICVVGSIGKLGIAPSEWAGANIARAVARIAPISDSIKDFLLLFLQSSHARRFFHEATRTLAQPTLNIGLLEEIPIPLPPLAEQHRIVAKVDELMALCDQLEAARQQREQTRERLVAASLQRLNQPSEDPASFRQHAQFALQTLPTLTTTPAQIKQLRQCILNLAVRGKLVEQDPEDEPAEELLAWIAADRKLLSKSKSRNQSGPIQALPTEEHPYKLPTNWAWVRFGDIMYSRDGERIPVSKEERCRRAKAYDYYGASGVIDKIDGFLFDKPLLLIGEDGANLLNRSTPIAFIARGQYWVNNHAHVLDGISEEFLRFIELTINATDLTPYVTGTAQPKMNQAKMNSIPIALPPLAEQHRIVAKVDELMALCDHLEQQLSQANQQRRRLLEAVLAEALRGPEDAAAPVGSALPSRNTSAATL